MTISADTRNRLIVGLARVEAADEVANTLNDLTTAQLTFGRTDAGVKDLLVGWPTPRTVFIYVTPSAAFANGNGTQPTLTIGEESGSASKFAAAALFTNAPAGTAVVITPAMLTAGKKLQATLVAATGTTSTGAYTIDISALG